MEQHPEGSMGPIAHYGNQWVGFDDVNIIREKSKLVKEQGFGGGMIWALDLDDFRNECGCEKYPLLRTINRVLRNYSVPDPQCTLGATPYAQQQQSPAVSPYSGSSSLQPAFYNANQLQQPFQQYYMQPLPYHFDPYRSGAFVNGKK